MLDRLIVLKAVGSKKTNILDSDLGFRKLTCKCFFFPAVIINNSDFY